MLVAREESNPQSPLLRFELLSDRELANPSLAVKRQKFTRRLMFDERRNLFDWSCSEKPYLLLQHHGFAYWCWRGENKMFYWKNDEGQQKRLSSDWVRQTPDVEIRRQIKEMLADTRSDCVFVWRWMQCDAQQRIQLIFSVDREIVETCERVLHAYAWSHPLWSDDIPLKWVFQIGVSSSENLKENTFLVGGDGTRANQLNASGHIVLLRTLIWRHLDSHKKSELAKQIAPNQKTYLQHDFWIVQVPIPTAHERLEGRLLLRDWLRDKVSSTELAELMDNS